MEKLMNEEGGSLFGYDHAMKLEKVNSVHIKTI